MKLRVFVDRASTYNYVEIDTDNLLVSSFISSGHLVLSYPSSLYPDSGDAMPSIIINDLIHDLIDNN